MQSRALCMRPDEIVDCRHKWAVARFVVMRLFARARTAICLVPV